MMQKENIIKWRKTCHSCNKVFQDEMESFMGRFPIRVRDFKTKTGECLECYRQRREKFKIEYKEKIRVIHLNWDFDSVRKHFINNPPYMGQHLLIHDTSYNMNTYALVSVVEPCFGKMKKIRIEGYTNGYSGLTFYRTGKNVCCPTGQARLLPYHSVIGGLIKDSKIRSINLEYERVKDILSTAKG